VTDSKLAPMFVSRQTINQTLLQLLRNGKRRHFFLNTYLSLKNNVNEKYRAIKRYVTGSVRQSLYSFCLQYTGIVAVQV